MPRLSGLSSLAGAAILAVALAAAGPASAQPVPPDAYDGGVLDSVSRTLFGFDRAFYSGLNAVGHWISGPAGFSPTSDSSSSAIGHGIGNVASNLVNEPVTMVAGLAMGALDTSWYAARRFAINSTVGVLGWYDTATNEWDLPRRHEDMGLLLCKAGVGEGGYVVLPLVGPRTLRDAVADIVITNAVLWSLAGAALGTGITLQTILIAETVEIAADILATRQMDSNAAEMDFENYERMRAAYLTQRRARCDTPMTPAAISD
jgi:phospholipid-binding lipoprotein MlaA